MFKRIIKLIKSLRPKTPLAKLEEKLIELKDTDLRNAAEHAYALAILYKNKGDEVKAVHFGRDAIQLLDRCKLRTEWDSTVRNATIEGVVMPKTIGKDVVREHLKPLILSTPTSEKTA